MSTAICIRCGEMKKSPFKACQRCRFDPRGDRYAMAQSLMLSTDYYDPETDHRPTKLELQAARQRISAGQPVDWNEQVLVRLVAEQGVLERAGSPSWVRIILLILSLFLMIAAPVALVVAALMYFMR